MTERVIVSDRQAFFDSFRLGDNLKEGIGFDGLFWANVLIKYIEDPNAFKTVEKFVLGKGNKRDRVMIKKKPEDELWPETVCEVKIYSKNFVASFDHMMRFTKLNTWLNQRGLRLGDQRENVEVMTIFFKKLKKVDETPRSHI